MRGFACRWFALVALLGLGLVGSSPGAADELVKFAGAAPTLPLAQGMGNGAHQPRSELGIQGFLTKPKGDGPFAAVIVLHSCLGLRSDRGSIANALAGQGFVVLFVDDFTTRGLKETCAVDFPQDLSDAFGALAFMASLPYVDKDRIAALGYSQGAATTLKIASLGAASGFAIPEELNFKAVAAFYPACGVVAGARLRIPTLILIGAADTVTPAADCERLARRQPAAGTKLVVYPGAGHVFDDPEFTGGKSVLGMWLKFDPGAAAQSQSALSDFLARVLAR